MPSSIPERKRQNIKVKLEVNEPIKKIAKDANVSECVVYAYRKSLRVFGTLKPPKLPTQGRPRKLTPDMEEVCVLQWALMSQKLLKLAPS